jgi:hypothetical protein
MSDQPDLEKGIYRVHLYIKAYKNGKSYYMSAISDLIFLEGVPTLVLEWGGPMNNQYPLVKVEIDPTQLERSPSQDGVYFYRVPIEDPRTTH